MLSGLSRRALLATLLTSPLVRAAERYDVLLVGDSLAFQLAPRLRRALGTRTLSVDARGGSSARQWVQRGWFQRAVERARPRRVVVSLGVNCIRPERATLTGHVESMLSRVDVPVLWILPGSVGYKFSLAYAHAAVRAAGLEPLVFPVRRPRDPQEGLALDHDRVHLTHEGNEALAELVVSRLA